MPLALVAALAASLALHGVAFLLPDVDLALSPLESEHQGAPPPLEAHLVMPPAPTPAPPPAAKPAAQPARPAPQPPRQPRPARPQLAVPGPGPAVAAAPVPEAPATPAAPAAPPPAVPQPPRQTARGELEFKVYRGDQGLEVGRALQRWEFSPLAEGGTAFRFYSLTETTGLAAFLKPVRMESESTGRLGPGGLQPEHFRVSRDGGASGESADFDWSAGQVKMGRKEAVHPLAPGSQDLLTFHYQFPYLGALENGVAFKVATGKKYELFNFDYLGDETIEVPAGRFQTLHLQALGSSRTELWLAREHGLLPVRIRHTDKKGDTFEQVAVQIKLN